MYEVQTQEGAAPFYGMCAAAESGGAWRKSDKIHGLKKEHAAYAACSQNHWF